MNRVFVILITGIAVPIVLNTITTIAEKNNTSSLTSFSMKPPKEIATIGIVLLAFLGLMLMIVVKGNQYNKIIGIMLVVLISLGAFLCLLPVKGFWEFQVENDTITTSKLWVFRKEIMISDIDYCVSNNNCILIYEKENGKPQISIENIFTNVNNFKKRMKKEGIETKNSIV